MLDRALDAAVFAVLAFGLGAILATCTGAAFWPGAIIPPAAILGPAAVLAVIVGAIVYRDGGRA